MATLPEDKPTHIEGENFRGAPTENPIADTFNIVVSVPESVNIKMVNASALSDYEIWAFIASLLSNAVVGFLIAYLQAVEAKSGNATNIGWSLTVFIILFALALITAVAKRILLSKKGREVKLRTSSATISKPD
jgi:putative copper export protein